MAHPRRKQDGPPGDGTSQVFHTDNPQRQYLDQFERVVERIKKHPSLNTDDRNAAFCAMVAHAAAGIAVDESNKEAQHLAYNAQKQSEPSSIMSRALESIDKLLSAAQEIMKREPTLDREALEYMRRLRVKVRRAVSAATEESAEAVPARAPELFKERKDKSESPVDFIKRVYEPYLHKEIVRADIAKLDPRLYGSLSTWIAKNDGVMPNIGLPTKREAIEKRLNDTPEEDLKPPSRSVKIEDLSQEEQKRLRLYRVSLGRRRKALGTPRS